jgi:hypothetical protein
MPDHRDGACRQLIGRRDALAMMAVTGASIASVDSTVQSDATRVAMRITCVIRYQIDPLQRAAFAESPARLTISAWNREHADKCICETAPR